MNRKLLSSLAGLALAFGLAGTASGAPPAVGEQSAPAWKDFTQRTIDRWFELDPAYAVYQGAHQYDGKLPDWSDAGLKARADFLRSVIAAARTYSALTGADAFERDYLIQIAEGQLFWLADADQPHTNPTFYIGGGLDPNVYVTREYADKPARMKAMIAFFEAVPVAARTIRANLRTPLPASFIKQGVAGFGGFAEYYRGDARAAFADVQDPALQARFRDTSEAAAQAMSDLAGWLKAQHPGPEGSYALGADRFSRMLKTTEGVDVPLDQLDAVGRADLRRNQTALRDACAAYAPGKTIPECFAKLNADKPPEGPVAAAAKQIPELTAFVRAHDLATIPGTEQVLVREAPPYNRQNGAYIDPPGPYEKGDCSVYKPSRMKAAHKRANVPQKAFQQTEAQKALGFSARSISPGHPRDNGSILPALMPAITVHQQKGAPTSPRAQAKAIFTPASPASASLSPAS
jgi:hypothetical protein